MTGGSEKIRAVVFDFGGVMTTSATPLRVKAIVEAKGLPWAAVLEGFRRYRRDYDAGDVTVGEFYRRTWRDAGLSVDVETQSAIEEADTASFLYPNPQTLAWMKTLKEQGLRLAILTNMPHELAPRFREHFAAFIELAEVLIVSSEVHLVKPQMEIYRLMEEKLALQADEIAFVDDSEVNCEGARAAGWRAVRFQTNSQAEAELSTYLS